MEKEENKTILTPEEETLILVRKLWRAEKWRRFWTIFRYVIYIGVILGSFYFLAPYIEKTIQSIQEFQSIKNPIKDPQDLQNFLQQLQK